MTALSLKPGSRNFSLFDGLRSTGGSKHKMLHKKVEKKLSTHLKAIEELQAKKIELENEIGKQEIFLTNSKAKETFDKLKQTLVSLKQVLAAKEFFDTVDVTTREGQNKLLGVISDYRDQYGQSVFTLCLPTEQIKQIYPANKTDKVIDLPAGILKKYIKWFESQCRKTQAFQDLDATQRALLINKDLLQKVNKQLERVDKSQTTANAYQALGDDLPPPDELAESLIAQMTLR